MPKNQERNEFRPRVLIATNALTGGGAQQSNVRIALGLARNGFPTSVLTVRPHDPHDLVELDPNTTLYDVQEERWPRWIRAPHVLRRVLRVVSEDRIDLVISGSFGLNQILLAARAVRILRCPVIVVEHLGIKFRLDVLSRSKPFAAQIFRHALTLLYRYADKVVAVSHGVATEFECVLGLPSNTITTIYNGIDAEAIHSKTSERPEIHFANKFQTLTRPIIISVGRLEPQKAHEDLLAAFSLLPADSRGNLVILGEGSRRAELASLSEELGLSASVHLPGRVANPWWFMAKSDVFVLSSHHEGFGLVLAEALACGIPVVSTDCTWGPREILETVENATLVPVKDPVALSCALSDALRNAKNFRLPASFDNRFTQESHAQSFVHLTQQTIASSRP